MRLAGLTWCTLTALSVPPLAHAQSEPTREQIATTEGQRAAPFFQQGLTAADEGRWADAEVAYLKAWAIAKTYDIAANLGVVELKLGKPRLAAIHLAFSLRAAPPSTKAPNLERTTQLIERAAKQLGVLRVRVNVAEATVLIDGKPLLIEETPEEIFVDPGTHRVTARRDGYADAEKIVTVAAGTAQSLTLALVERPAVPQTTAPPAASPTPSGEAPAARVDLSPEAKRSWVPVLALGAASVVGLGVGVGMTVASNDANDEARAQSRSIRGAGGQCVGPSTAFAARCAELNRRGSQAHDLGDVAFGSYIASGVFALAAATYVLWPSRAGTSSTAVSVRPDVRLNGGGIVAVGTW
ncbi:PEGA domain-containing protein [Sorangium sp. So ce124]|uniref:PEGA domain-containing protein n=1 Tax=Sorangium sp. So ce124 TaxID=3133280 RepID=UPI003F61A4B8